MLNYVRRPFRAGTFPLETRGAKNYPDGNRLLLKKTVIALSALLILCLGVVQLVYSVTPQSSTAYWFIETADSTVGAGSYSSLVLDSAGNPHISYFEDNNFDLKYAVKSGGV